MTNSVGIDVLRKSSTPAYGIGAMIPIARMMRCARSIVLPMFAGCATLAAGACDQRVHLGEIGEGAASLLWRATFEPGDLSEWTSDGNGGTRVRRSVCLGWERPGTSFEEGEHSLIEEGK